MREHFPGSRRVDSCTDAEVVRDALEDSLRAWLDQAELVLTTDGV